jgi:hypothetical protein
VLGTSPVTTYVDAIERTLLIMIVGTFAPVPVIVNVTPPILNIGATQFNRTESYVCSDTGVVAAVGGGNGISAVIGNAEVLSVSILSGDCRIPEYTLYM